MDIVNDLLRQIRDLERQVRALQRTEVSLSALGAVAYSGTPTAGAITYWTGAGTVAHASFGTADVVRTSGTQTVAGDKTFEGNTVLQTTTAMSYPVILVNRNVTATTAPLGTFGLRLTTTGEMADTFGPRFIFEANDATLSTQNLVGAIAVQRNGADNSFDMSFQTASGGTLADKVWITKDGDLSIGTASAAARLHVLESTLGDEVMRLTSTATNDDPRESVYQARAATTNATATTLWSMAVPSSTTLGIFASVVARRTGGSSGTAEDGAFYIVTTAVKNVAGTATVISGAFTGPPVYEDQTGWSATFDVSGGDVRLRVTGAADNNVTWHATVRVYPVSS